jgi:DNA-binding MarR family transcriptional regulator
MPTTETDADRRPAGVAAPGSGDAMSAVPSDDAERDQLVGQLIDELGAWRSRDRVGVFRAFVRGSLSVIHLHVLALLEAAGPLAMSRLAEALDVSVASATGIITRIENRGLVERRHATEDRRNVFVHATPEGLRVFATLEEGRRDRLARILAELSPHELAAFLTGLRAMRAAGNRLAEAGILGDEPMCPGAPVVRRSPRMEA